MKTVEIIVVAINIDDSVVDRFYKFYEKAIENIGWKCDCTVIRDVKYITSTKDGYVINKSKALNDGIRDAIDREKQIIITTDIDCIINTKLIKKSIEYAQQGYNAHCVVRNTDSVPQTDDLNIPMRETSKGCWNAMMVSNWISSGGFNEEIQGWGYEDEEFHNRLTQRGIPIKKITNIPFYHINHPDRKQIRQGDYNKYIAFSKDWSDYNWIQKQFSKKIKPSKPPKLCIADKAMGLGDGIMCVPTVDYLSKLGEVRIIASPPSYKILSMFQNEYTLKVFDMNNQGHFYNNDHLAKDAINLIYWDVFNTLRHFDCHAINAIRQCANLPKIDGDVLPHIPIPAVDEHNMDNFIQCLPRPIILVQPFLSYWNKMIDIEKYHKIVSELAKIGTVVQVGTKLPGNMISSQGVNLIGETSLTQSLALLRLCDVAFLPDSFLQHAAAFTKTPTVTYFCGTSPEAFGYPFHINLFHPEIAPCQMRCGRPMRWLYDYSYKDKNKWDSRSEEGWICPHKLCEKSILVEEVIEAVKTRLEFGRNVNWEFHDYKYNQPWYEEWR